MARTNLYKRPGFGKVQRVKALIDRTWSVNARPHVAYERLVTLRFGGIEGHEVFELAFPLPGNNLIICAPTFHFVSSGPCPCVMAPMRDPEDAIRLIRKYAREILKLGLRTRTGHSQRLIKRSRRNTRLLMASLEVAKEQFIPYPEFLRRRTSAVDLPLVSELEDVQPAPLGDVVDGPVDVQEGQVVVPE